MSGPHPPARLRPDQSGAVSISLLLWLAVAGVLLYALFGASSGDIDRFGRVSVPGSAFLDLPGGESDISYVEDAATAGSDVQAPTDLRVLLISTQTGVGIEVDSRGGNPSEQDGEVVRPYGAVNPPSEGLYEVRVTSNEAATRPNPQLAFGDSPFGAIGDRLSRVGDLITGPFGVLLGALVIAAIVAPRAQRILRR